MQKVETGGRASRYAHEMRKIEVEQAIVPVDGSASGFPVRRVFCIGTNYAAHSREMGGDPDRQPPFYFAKSADAVVPGGGIIDYPPRTHNLHHEIELVVAIGKSGADISAGEALSHVFGYAAGIDLTRRDLQAQAKKAGRPWDTAKNFDQSAPISAIRQAADIGHPVSARIWLSVNDEIRQDANIDELIWSVSESIAEISSYCALAAGDLIFTGTPAGVGPLVSGDKVTGGIEGVANIEIEIRQP